MGGNQSQQQSLNPYESQIQDNLGPPLDYEYSPSQRAQFATYPGVPFNPQGGGNPYPPQDFETYMNLLYEDLKTKAAYDPANAGYDTASQDQGFSF